MKIPTLLTLLLLHACSGFQPPTLAPIQREGTTLPVSFGRAWEAAVEVLAKQNLTVDKIERASGYISFMPAIASERRGAFPTEHSWADCGSGPSGGGHEWPTHVRYNVVVRGDSTTSRVLVSARFLAGENDCVSRGVMEQNFEELIAQRVKALSAPPER